MKVLVLHNQASPYRLPIFEEINRAFDTTVYFCEIKSRDRLWKTNLKGYSFKWKVIGRGKLGNIILVSPRLFIDAMLGGWDAYLIADNPETIFATLMVITAGILRRKPVIVWSEKIDSPWNWERLSPSKKLAVKLWDRFVFGVSSIIVAYSRKALDYLRRRRVSPGKMRLGIQVMPEETLPKEEKVPQRRKKLKECRRKLLYLGYLRPEKNIESLIRVFSEIQTDSCLLIAGTGPLREYLKKRYGNKRVIFCGYVEEEEKPFLYRESDALILPTLRDSWGLVVNEALYYGTPVIVTTAAGAAMIIDKGKTGFVVDAQSPEELKSVIEKLLNEPKKVRKMKVIARKVGKKYADRKLGARALIRAISDALVDS